MAELSRIGGMIIAATAIALAGCTGAEGEGAGDGGDAATSANSDADEASTSAAAITMGETGWLSVGVDGAVQTTFFDPNGRFRDLRNGDLLAEGNWERRADGMLCFEPDSGLGACWETGEPDDSGNVIATDTQGKRIEIKQVTYIAPEAPEDSSEESN